MQQPDPDLGWNHRYSVQWKPTQPKSFYKIHVNENQTYPAPCGVSPASRTSDPWTFASQSRNQARGGIHQQIWDHHNSVISLSDRNRVEITNFSTDHRYASGVIYFQGASFYVLQSLPGVYILENTPPPWGEEKISADVIWGKKYEKVKRKRGENVKEKGRKEKKKEESGKKMRKEEVKG